MNTNNILEEWKIINEFDTYEISTFGRVKNRTNGKYLTLNRLRGKPNCQYICVALYQDKKQHNVSPHILVAKYFIDNPNGYNQVDHIDCNRMNNNYTNLRWCNGFQNCSNKNPKQKNNTSGYKGVSIKNNKWFASIGFNNKRISIGTFDNKEDAAKAYNEKALELFGEYANLNIINDI